jgi:Autotransporter beta-domain/Calx-beta domain/Bacterial Ig-like domain (group 1)
LRRPFSITALLLLLASAHEAAAARLPAARITASGQSVVEGNAGITTITLVVSIPAGSNNDAVGTYTTADGTATVLDNDYLPTTGQIIIPAGQTNSQPIDLQIVGDRKVEADETFTFNVHFTFGAQDPEPYVITIVNDDAPSIAVGEVRVAEGNNGLTPMTFDVTLTSAAAVPISATYQTTPVTAIEGDDYQAAKGTIIFPPGQTKQSITVNVIGDNAVEPDETFTLTVTPAGGTPVTTTGTILNDDKTQPAALVIVSGNNQQGRLGQTLAQPLVIRLIDQNGLPFSGIAVQWRVTKGDATLNPTSGTTDAKGEASTAVTLNSVGAVEVTVTVDRFTVKFTLGSATSFEDRAQGPVAVPIAHVLDGICARNEQTFASVCRALSLLPDAALTPTLERVAPQESGAQSKVASEVISAVTAGIGARLAAVRTGVQRLSVSDLSIDVGGRSVPLGALAKTFLPKPMTSAAGSGEQDDYNGWSAFLSGNLGSGRRITHPGEIGFDLDSHGLMAGVDRQFGVNVFGLSLNLMRLDSTLSENVGSVDVDGYALSLYGSRGGLLTRGAPAAGAGTHFDGVHVDGSLTVGRNRYKSEHIVDITGMPLSTATSSNDANVFALAGVTGLEAHRGRGEFDVSLGGTWSRAHVSDLTEDGSGPLILFVQGHDIDSLTGTAAFSAKGAWPVAFGTLLPTFRAELIHEFKGAARLVTARFVRDSLGTSFTIPLDRPDTNYGRIAAGLQAVFARGVSLHIEGSQDVSRSDLKFRNVQLTLSKSF